ncbi:MAG TPA: CotO family spore coat protein [Virgibacillus sp.]|nr:CotO family spore coat protein [Virgibacillus sp.]
MGERQFAKEPLLYIEQPTIQKPEAPMQQSFMTPKRVTETTNRKQSKSHSRPRRRAQYYIDQLYNSVADELDGEEQVDEKNSREQSRQKKFNELSLQGKIEYFADTPNYAPKIKCELITAERKYRGIITDFKDDFVFIRVGRRTTNTKVPFTDIQDIRMLGF